MSPEPEPATLEELIRAHRQSPSEQTLQELFAHLLPIAIRAARKVVWRTKVSNSLYHTADDFASEALLRFLKHLNTINDFTAIERWFTKTIMRMAIDHAKHSSRREQTPGEIPDVISTMGVPGAGYDVVEAVHALSDDHRDVVICTYWYGLTSAEIARYLGIPQGTVKTRLHYALRYLREWLSAV